LPAVVELIAEYTVAELQAQPAELTSSVTYAATHWLQRQAEHLTRVVAAIADADAEPQNRKRQAAAASAVGDCRRHILQWLTVRWSDTESGTPGQVAQFLAAGKVHRGRLAKRLGPVAREVLLAVPDSGLRAALRTAAR
jgi:hypothetical protein